MRELLLAYLFGQLGPDQRDEVEQALAERPQLREEFQRLRECLGVAAAEDPGPLDPPGDLAERTCHRVAEIVSRSDAEFNSTGAVHSPHSSASRRDPLRRPPAAPLEPSPAECGCSFADLSIAIGITFVAAMILFPALHESRVLARRHQCQNNLQNIYQGTSVYAMFRGGAIPHVSAHGRDSFAGIFAVLLGEADLIDRRELPQLLLCPAAIRNGEDWKERALVLSVPIPTYEQLMALPEEQFQLWRRHLAGSYAYRLGYIDEDGRYRPWRLDFSARSALLADAPSPHLAAMQSANHGGNGLNLVFADGHVKFLCNCTSLECGDHLFLNRAGLQAAGMDEVDNVLAPSEVSPSLELIRPWITGTSN